MGSCARGNDGGEAVAQQRGPAPRRPEAMYADVYLGLRTPETMYADVYLGLRTPEMMYADVYPGARRLGVFAERR